MKIKNPKDAKYNMSWFFNGASETFKQNNFPHYREVPIDRLT